MTHAPQTIKELQALISDSNAVSIADGSGPSQTLNPAEGLDSSDSQSVAISLHALNRIIEYQPEEYTITVEAGALVSDIQAALAKLGQYLPFDPPFLETDSTIGEVVACGFSGPRAYRYGILRDFIIGVNFIDGLGKAVKAGGKVVKNAAGFDLPKLFVGSGYSLGILTQVTFKVFPKPEANHSIEFKCDSLEQCLDRLVALGRSRFTLDALDLDASGALRVGLSGQANALEKRVQDLQTFLESESEETASDAWPESIALQRIPDSGALVKVPTTPSSIKQLNQALQNCNAAQRYSLGGFVSWIHWTDPIDSLDSLLRELGLSGQIASAPPALIGQSNQRPFYDRVKRALDPQNKFPYLYPTANEVGMTR